MVDDMLLLGTPLARDPTHMGSNAIRRGVQIARIDANHLQGTLLGTPCTQRRVTLPSG